VENREEYRKRTESKIDDLERKVWAVKQRADEATGAAKIEYEELFDVLHAKLEQVREEVEGLDTATEETWQDVAAKIDGTLSDLNSSVGNVLSRLS
jgi:type I restriction-modification system DNA methylase subunit